MTSRKITKQNETKASHKVLKNIFKGKKAQITVFLIVGIIMLFSSALIFYIRGQVVDTLEGSTLPEAEEVPLEAQPIKIYVENCMDRIAKEAIQKMALHGGYVEPENEVISGIDFTQTLEPTESDGVELMIPGMFIPYWWYLETPNNCQGNCQFNTLRPQLYKKDSPYSVESQLDAYINRELPRCIDNFKPFVEQGFEFNILGDVSTDLRVGEDDITVLVDYPIETVKEDRKTEISKYYTKIDLDLKRIFNMATDIINEEIDISFFELHTMELISLYSTPLSSNKLPPPAEFTIDPNEFLVWTRTESKDRLESYVLPSGIGMFQVYESANYRRVVMLKTDEDSEEPVFDKIGTGLMDRTLIKLPVNYTDLSASFTYLDWWPMYLNINDQEVLMGTRIGSSLLSFIGLNSYEFYYDLSYPVMITLSDPEAFDGEGLDFNFAVEVNLRGNLPVNVSTELTKVSQGSLVCEPNQKNGLNANINVLNKVTLEPIEEARVSFVLGSEGCQLGVTEIHENGTNTLSEKLPAGMGELRVNHIDYLDYAAPMISVPNNTMDMNIELMPYKYLNVTAYTRPLSYDQNTKKYVLPDTLPVSPLSSKETAVIILERQDDDEFADYKAEAAIEGNSAGLAKLIPGLYKVSSYLILNDTVVIPAESTLVGDSLFSSGETIRVNRSEFDQWTEGGVLFNEVTGYIELTENCLLNADKLRFYLLRFPKPQTHSSQFKNAASIEQTAQLEEYSEIYRYALVPQWDGCEESIRVLVPTNFQEDEEEAPPEFEA